MICRYFCLVLLTGLVCLQATNLSAHQQIQYSPHFRSVPTTVRDRENGSAILPCQVDNLELSTVRWWRMDKLLAERTPQDETPRRSVINPRVTLRTDNALQVDNLTYADTGEYLCQVVRPPPWPPIKQMHNIEVLYPAKVTLVPEEEIVFVRLGEQVNLECNAVGVPAPVFLWNFTGYVPLSEEEVHELRKQSKLQFIASTRHVTGTYQCLATNAIGDPASAELRLIVQHPPEITAERSWVHATPGVRAELTCLVVAEPSAQVTWYRDLGFGRELESIRPSSRVYMMANSDRYSLMVLSMRESDFGNYTCVARNELGQARQVLQFSGQPNPAVIKGESKMTDENSYELIWEVDSYSPIYEYMLQFKKENDADWSNLTVPVQSALGSTRLHSSWYIFRGLNAYTKYHVKIYSRNRFGWSAPSSLFSFSTILQGNGSNSMRNNRKNDESSEEVVIIPSVAATASATSKPVLHKTQQMVISAATNLNCGQHFIIIYLFFLKFAT